MEKSMSKLHEGQKVHVEFDAVVQMVGTRSLFLQGPDRKNRMVMIEDATPVEEPEEVNT
jgi:hypothetical protein